MDVKNQIRHYVVENLMFGSDGFELQDSTSFLKEGIVDSTGVVELVLFVEETFGIEVDDEDIVPDNFDSISSLTSYVARRSAVQ